MSKIGFVIISLKQLNKNDCLFLELDNMIYDDFTLDVNLVLE